MIVDRDANIVWMNERYARRFGLESAAGAIGKPCESVIPGSLLREVVRSGRPILLDMQDTPKEPLVVMRLPIHDDAGTVIGAIGFASFDELRTLSPMLKRYLSMQAGTGLDPLIAACAADQAQLCALHRHQCRQPGSQTSRSPQRQCRLAGFVARRNGHRQRAAGSGDPQCFATGAQGVCQHQQCGDP